MAINLQNGIASPFVSAVRHADSAPAAAKTMVENPNDNYANGEREMRKQTFGASVVALVIGAITLLGFANPAAAATAATTSTTTTPNSATGIQGTCGDIFDVYVSGGEAHWNITCYSNGTMNISGNVKDTAADGLCAFVKAFASDGESRVPLAKACPKGTTTWYNWTTTYASTWINAYLFTG